ncbi:MAG: hypothetical protein HC824_12135 [Synechococcales cyanobacterium RM1_1_8]|nr:hypothetical protein [Synechococcales cyanobacterium RM1_1_8]
MTLSWQGNQRQAQVQDSIGQAGDLRDYYRFSLDQAGEVSLTLSGMGDNANLQLLDGSGQRLGASYQSGTKDDIIRQRLEAGTYYALVFGKTATVQTAYDLLIQGPGTNTATPIALEPITPLPQQQANLVADPAPALEASPEPAPLVIPLDWFTANFQDQELMQLGRDRFADGKLDRFDMIDLLRSAGDGNQVDSLEFEDLQTLMGAAATLNLEDYVFNLANKVINGDRANQWYTGGSRQRQDLGNLQAGSDAKQLDQLIGKWFLGSDRPTTLSTSHKYQHIAGSLFQNGISVNDITQAQLGDCYLMSVLGGVAHENPQRH